MNRRTERCVRESIEIAATGLIRRDSVELLAHLLLAALLEAALVIAHSDDAAADLHEATLDEFVLRLVGAHDES